MHYNTNKEHNIFKQKSLIIEKKNKSFNLSNFYVFIQATFLREANQDYQLKVTSALKNVSKYTPS